MSHDFIIRIRDLKAEVILGAYDWEKGAKRPIILNLAIYVKGSDAGISDALEDAVDYALIEELILGKLFSASYQLIEALVSDIGALILSRDPRITKVEIEADKPGALKHARSVAVALTLERK